MNSVEHLVAFSYFMANPNVLNYSGPILSSRGREKRLCPLRVRPRLWRLRVDRLHREPHHRRKLEPTWNEGT